MAGTPRFKVFDPSGQYVAACKHLSDAAVIVSAYGDGAQIRDGHLRRDILWNEGQERYSAGSSYDQVAEVCATRIRERWERLNHPDGSPKFTH